ncbi:hypothetical protein [Kutzneria sp. CA-103260]|uniref:hypothetical protein n=1 Tax=Kutzneria sp. CA-103260 TaxID=2802641 RepID=UPI001BA7C2AE|nr:hypothetical protein [Kutzneria sp. CA-103260]QUQ62827.1 hypothetical protein JJ691_05390 [Kutzneria sp. CA-103260]
MGDKFDLSKAHISGSAIGSRSTVNNNYGAPADALLAALVAQRADLLRDAPADGRDDVRARLDEIEAQLRSGVPNRDAVRSGWQRIAGIVGVLSEPVMEITKLIAKFLS